jgi:hypothetical protein
MADAIPVGKTLSIRECGLNERWLQDQILSNPSCLALGELDVLSRERLQASGGRLDFLLKDPEDDSMYEVELMLGETDESHIIRTIEYWDNEKRRWPQRQHFAVLVAEKINRRFFNVIQMLSHAIPIIAIQANIIEANGTRILSFTKVLDTYQEPEETEPTVGAFDESYWSENASWTLEAAKTLLEVTKPVLSDGTLNYVKNYIALQNSGNNYFSLKKRSGNKSLVNFWVGNRLLPNATTLLDEKRIPYTVRKGESLRITTDKEAIRANAEMFRQVGSLVQQAWES